MGADEGMATFVMLSWVYTFETYFLEYINLMFCDIQSDVFQDSDNQHLDLILSSKNEIINI